MNYLQNIYKTLSRDIGTFFALQIPFFLLVADQLTAEFRVKKIGKKLALRNDTCQPLNGYLPQQG